VDRALFPMSGVDVYIRPARDAHGEGWTHVGRAEGKRNWVSWRVPGFIRQGRYVVKGVVDEVDPWGEEGDGCLLEGSAAPGVSRGFWIVDTLQGAEVGRRR
ncbi:hypothetical protein HK101_003939, partial [Irineochytrium annulatum]